MTYDEMLFDLTHARSVIARLHAEKSPEFACVEIRNRPPKLTKEQACQRLTFAHVAPLMAVIADAVKEFVAPRDVRLAAIEARLDNLELTR